VKSLRADLRERLRKKLLFLYVVEMVNAELFKPKEPKLCLSEMLVDLSLFLVLMLITPAILPEPSVSEPDP